MVTGHKGTSTSRAQSSNWELKFWHLGMAGGIFGCQVGWVGGAYWHLVDRDHHAAKHPAVHRCLPQQLSSSEHHSAKAEKPWCTSLPSLGLNALYIPPPLPELFLSLLNISDSSSLLRTSYPVKMMILLKLRACRIFRE